MQSRTSAASDRLYNEITEGIRDLWKAESTEFRTITTNTASDRLYNEIDEGIRAMWKAEKYRISDQRRLIAFITKLPRAFAPYENQKSTEFRTNTASDRLYSEIVEGIRAIWKAENRNLCTASDRLYNEFAEDIRVLWKAKNHKIRTSAGKQN